ncbi:hypothetical protein [Paludisphaera rhizosphaerae]|uniref:hypothetical protein n=1 Tax=Paludisphaera rhizosphaerae TaxID=2711216 RepID=UPI0013ED2EB9|nr:hypothetical protein [Paludisphaera rhizosphaerae]
MTPTVIRRRPVCGRCGSCIVERESGCVVSVIGRDPRLLASSTLCDDCSERLAEWLGARTLRSAETPRTAVVDPRRFESR